MIHHFSRNYSAVYILCHPWLNSCCGYPSLPKLNPNINYRLLACYSEAGKITRTQRLETTANSFFFFFFLGLSFFFTANTRACLSHCRYFAGNRNLWYQSKCETEDMAKSSADDAELRRACEAAIESTKQKVVMSIRVSKSRRIWG